MSEWSGKLGNGVKGQVCNLYHAEYSLNLSLLMSEMSGKLGNGVKGQV